MSIVFLPGTVVAVLRVVNHLEHLFPDFVGLQDEPRLELPEAQRILYHAADGQYQSIRSELVGLNGVEDGLLHYPLECHQMMSLCASQELGQLRVDGIAHLQVVLQELQDVLLLLEILLGAVIGIIAEERVESADVDGHYLVEFHADEEDGGRQELGAAATDVVALEDQPIDNRYGQEQCAQVELDDGLRSAHPLHRLVAVGQVVLDQSDFAQPFVALREVEDLEARNNVFDVLDLGGPDFHFFSIFKQSLLQQLSKTIQGIPISIAIQTSVSNSVYLIVFIQQNVIVINLMPQKYADSKWIHHLLGRSFLVMFPLEETTRPVFLIWDELELFFFLSRDFMPFTRLLFYLLRVVNAVPDYFNLRDDSFNLVEFSLIFRRFSCWVWQIDLCSYFSSSNIFLSLSLSSF